MQASKSYFIEYKLHESSKVLIRSVIGKVTMHDVIAIWKEDIEKGTVNSDLKAVVTDFTKGENLAKMSDLKIIAAFYNENFDLFKHIKIAVVLTDKSVTIPLMYQHENPKIQHSVFSTLKAALNWAKS